MNKSQRKHHYKPFHEFDDLFLKKTVMPLVASRERSLTAFTQYEMISIPRRYIAPIGPASDDDMRMLHDMLNCLAQKVEHDLSVALSDSVLECNKGHAAGWISRCHNLGAPDQPVVIDSKAALPAIISLTNCAKEIPSFDSEAYVFIPKFVMQFILEEIELRYSAATAANSSRQPSIRPRVRAEGSICGFDLFTDEDITNECIAYAFYKGTVEWNFRFYIDDSQSGDNVTLLFNYCILIMHPEQVVRMVVTKGVAP